MTYLKIFLIIEILTFLGTIGMIVSSLKVDNIVKKKRFIKLISYIVIIHFMIISIIFFDRFFILVLLVIILICFYELISSSKSLLKTKFLTFIFGLIFFLVIVSGSIYFTLNHTNNWILFIFLLVCVLDSTSQISGQLFGKHHIVPNVSPNKTLEGFIGGILSCILTSIILGYLVQLNFLYSIAAGAFTAVTGILGDLTGSYYKRFLGIKDYSSLLPGQGGFIDRFNSFLFSLLGWNILIVGLTLQ